MKELGSRLMRARETRGLTLEDAERDTRISRRYLQALETEQFEVIPAPVYARGFLRSYSQYLGLDPGEMLSLFPRDEEELPPPAPTPRRASVKEPLSAVGPARPVWRKPSPPGRRAGESQDFSDDEPIGAAPPRGRETPSQPPARQQPTRQQPSRRQDAQEAPWEPTIGIDIGVPAPARKLKADPAAQARTMTVVLVAVGAIAAITLVAFLISRLGGDDNGGTSGGLFPGNDARTTTGLPTLATGTGASATQPSGGGANTAVAVAGVERGKVPDVRNQKIDQAKTMMTAAGYIVRELHQPHAEAKNTVFEQSPAPGVEWAVGSEVTLVVSDGT